MSNLTSQKIYDKEFSIEFKGFSAKEVDDYLDLIIEDYQAYEEQVETLENKILTLEKANAALKAQIVELEGRIEGLKENTPVSSTDILKRLSRLEELVENK